MRRGEVAYDDALDMLNAVEARLRTLRDENPHGLREKADRVEISRWLHRAYLCGWASQGR
jgi:hypothetical protein